MKAFQSQRAMGPEDTGLFMFDHVATPEMVIITGFGLETGLRDFYLRMEAKMVDQRAKDLFAKLAEVEIIHQQFLVQLYSELIGRKVQLDEFYRQLVQPQMEGGLTTDEYLDLYDLDRGDEIEIISLAMAIEAQALDLYLRAAAASTVASAKEMLLKIAEEERNHLAKLSHYLDHREESV